MRFDLGNKSILVKVKERSWFWLNVNKMNALCPVLQVIFDFFSILNKDLELSLTLNKCVEVPTPSHDKHAFNDMSGYGIVGETK